MADHLRGGGVELVVDGERFADRRRAKTGAQLAGIRRAQRAADAAMGVAAGLIRELRPGLTCEDVRAAMQSVCEELGAELPDDVIVSHGGQSADRPRDRATASRRRASRWSSTSGRATPGRAAGRT